MLDVQRALAGDDGALAQLREVTTSSQVDDVDAAQAHARPRARRVAGGRGCRTRSTTPRRRPRWSPRCGSDAAGPGRVPRRRRRRPPARRGAARRPPRPRSHARSSCSTRRRPTPRSTSDMPVLGSFALGFAELAAHRGDADRARELWALGTRLRANLVMLFQLELDGPLAEPSATTTEREACSAPWRERSSTAQPPTGPGADGRRWLRRSLAGACRRQTLRRYARMASGRNTATQPDAPGQRPVDAVAHRRPPGTARASRRPGGSAGSTSRRSASSWAAWSPGRTRSTRSSAA